MSFARLRVGHVEVEGEAKAHDGEEGDEGRETAPVPAGMPDKSTEAEQVRNEGHGNQVRNVFGSPTEQDIP